MITAAQALDALEKAVALKGADYVYIDQTTGIRAGSDKWLDEDIWCQYAAADGTPACIVGMALSITDPDAFEAVREYEAGGDSFTATRLHSGISDAPTVATMDAASVFYCAQSAQDGGKTWGEALEIARKRYAELWDDPNGVDQ